jgi:hypothetical protein
LEGIAGFAADTRAFCGIFAMADQIPPTIDFALFALFTRCFAFICHASLTDAAGPFGKDAIPVFAA